MPGVFQNKRLRRIHHIFWPSTSIPRVAMCAGPPPEIEGGDDQTGRGEDPWSETRRLSGGVGPDRTDGSRERPQRRSSVLAAHKCEQARRGLSK